LGRLFAARGQVLWRGGLTSGLLQHQSGLMKELLRLAWPIALARCAAAVIGFFDALMTAPLGETALAATTTGSVNVYAFTILPMGTVFILQSFSSQLHGRGDDRGALRFGRHGILLAGVVGVFALLAVPGIPLFVELFPYTDDLSDRMQGYLSLRMAGVGAFVATEALGNWFSGMGDTRAHMKAGLLAMVVNIALNAVFIYGYLGFPALGVTGAALASVLATWTGALYLVFRFVRFSRAASGPGLPTPTGPSTRQAAVRTFLRVLRFGLPNGLNWFVEFAAFLIFLNVVVADLGTSVLAAMMVVFSVNMVAFNPAFGLSSAGAVLVGQAIGRGEHHRVSGIVKRAIVASAVWQLTIAAAYVWAPEHLMSWFSPERSSGAAEGTSGLVAMGVLLLPIGAAWQLFDAVALCVGEALRAAGDTAWSLWARLIVAWLLFTPVSMLGVYRLGGGPAFAMWCVVGYMAILSALLLWRFRSGAWSRIELVGQPDVVDVVTS